MEAPCFNNNHWLVRRVVFGFGRVVLVAGWLWALPQADQGQSRGLLLCRLYPPSIYRLNECKLKPWRSGRLLVRHSLFYATACRHIGGSRRLHRDHRSLGVCRGLLLCQLPPSPYITQPKTGRPIRRQFKTTRGSKIFYYPRRSLLFRSDFFAKIYGQFSHSTIWKKPPSLR
jgi:hypothetical protein